MVRGILPFLAVIVASFQPSGGPVTVAGNGFPPVIDPEVRRAISSGSVRVLVELRIAGGFKPEGTLPDSAAVEAQRQAIGAARRTVLLRLAGTDFSLVREYETVPLLSLRIGADALAVLETMGDVVMHVHEDRRDVPSKSAN